MIAHNVNRQQKNLKFFEFGTFYQQQNGKYLETNELAIFMTGQRTAESWRATSEPVSFHDLSSLIRKIFNRFDISDPNQKPSEEPIFSYGLAFVDQGKILADAGQIDRRFARLGGSQTAGLLRDGAVAFAGG